MPVRRGSLAAGCVQFALLGLLAAACTSTHRSSDRSVEAPAARPAGGASPVSAPAVSGDAPAFRAAGGGDLAHDGAEPAPLTASALRIHFVNVGQGDCTFIRCPNGETILIDCGSSRETEPDAVKSYLQTQLAGETEIDLLVVTHPDADHYNLLPHVLSGVSIRRLAYAGDFDEYDAPRLDGNGGSGPSVSGWLRGVADSAEGFRLGETDFDPLSDESDLCGCGDASIFVLAADVPPKRSGSNFRKNGRSIVLLVRYGQFEAMLTGDATFDTEEVIDERYGEAIEVEVLKLGHHGSRSTSTSSRWARLTSPEVAIASAAFQNTYGHPSATVTRRVARYTVNGPAHRLRVWNGPDDPVNRTGYQEQIYSTGSNGTIVVTSDGQSYTVVSER